MTDHYTGRALERGGTATVFGNKSSPAVRQLIGRKHISPGMSILDYGAGPTGRNAEWLRERGFDVYAYDPYHGSDDANGWKGVSNKMVPVLGNGTHFDVFLTCFVINVIPYREQHKISAFARRIADKEIHITRNNDLIKSITNAYDRKDKYVYNFYLNEYPGTIFHRNDMYDFCVHGTRTSRGFQRLPLMEDDGYTLAKKEYGFRLYIR
jgi:hypothetical protein